MACEKCWGDAYLRCMSQPNKTQAEHYRDLLQERKDNPCTHEEQDGIETLDCGCSVIRGWRCPVHDAPGYGKGDNAPMDQGPRTLLTSEELGKWMNVAHQNALERERFADVARFYREALEDIANPMKRIQEEAKAEGCTVNGMAANELCQDANWLRDKARAALRRS